VIYISHIKGTVGGGKNGDFNAMLAARGVSRG
jgi:hypothetical protein